MFSNIGGSSDLPVTHIIRTDLDPELGDSYLTAPITITRPYCLWEIPEGSGHFYLAIWVHQVGAGFPNHHQRILAYRYVPDVAPPHPFFRDYI